MNSLLIGVLQLAVLLSLTALPQPLDQVSLPIPKSKSWHTLHGHNKGIMEYTMREDSTYLCVEDRDRDLLVLIKSGKVRFPDNRARDFINIYLGTHVLAYNSCNV